MSCWSVFLVNLFWMSLVSGSVQGGVGWGAGGSGEGRSVTWVLPGRVMAADS